MGAKDKQQGQQGIALDQIQFCIVNPSTKTYRSTGHTVLEC